jgi:PIN domain nuclease of toxin-antitoxin system
LKADEAPAGHAHFPLVYQRDEHLPDLIMNGIRDPANDVYLSVVSVWEAIVKFQIGKLPLPQPPEKYLPQQRERHRISSLPLDESSVSHLAVLPPIHRDPFDRMLVAQAIEHGLTFVTVDDAVAGYPVSVFRL